MTKYYRILDLDRIGKIENQIPYLYERGSWQVDSENLLMDRVIGYDGEYVGCSSMLLRVEQISESEANALIENAKAKV